MSGNTVAALAEAVAAAGGPAPALAELCALVAVTNDGDVAGEWRQVFPGEHRPIAGRGGGGRPRRRIEGGPVVAGPGPPLRVRRRPARARRRSRAS